MSLINQVLKDLERRRAPDRPGPARPAPAAQRRRTPLAAWWIVAAVGIGAALHWILAMEPQPPRPEIAHAAFKANGVVASDIPSPDVIPETSVGETTDSIKPMEIEQAPTAPAPNPEPEPTPDAAPSPVRLDEISRPVATNTVEPTTAPPDTHARIESEAPSPDQTISIERAGDEREHSDIDAARRAIVRGHHQQAERNLRGLLEEQPDHDKARELLASDLVRQGRLPAAIDLLEQGLDNGREPARFAYRLGRILLEQDQVERARTVLDTHAPPPAQNPDFQQLLAATHRQAGDHAAAETAYRRLTEVAPQRAVAWIGLGVSLEALDRTSDARGAYARVLEIGDPQATRFARQRLRAIQDSDGDRS